MGKRYEELDSLRGIAAIIVFISHLLSIFPYLASDNIVAKLLKYTPLKIIFFSGHESVIFFFILSGFVLSIPFYSSNTFNYSSYLIRRVCRIYIPYLVAIILGFVLETNISRGGISELTDFFNKLWTTPVNLSLILDHLLFLGSFNTDSINTVVWSLVHEMRISIIFPILMYLVLRLDFRINILIALCLSSTSYILNIVFPTQYSETFTTNYFYSLHYAGMFIIGALLAQNRDSLITIIRSRSKRQKSMLAFIAPLIYCFFHIPSFIYPSNWDSNIRLISNDWITVLGASLILLLALSVKKISKLLLNRGIVYLGKISYSLYLYHILILFSLVYILNNIIPLWSIAILSICITFIVSTISYYLIELHSIRLGKILTKNDYKVFIK